MSATSAARSATTAVDDERERAGSRAVDVLAVRFGQALPTGVVPNMSVRRRTS